MLQMAAMASRTTDKAHDDRAVAATYVATLCTEMATIARRHGLDTLGYILDMAKLEAENVLRSDAKR